MKQYFLPVLTEFWKNHYYLEKHKKNSYILTLRMRLNHKLTFALNSFYAQDKFAAVLDTSSQVFLRNVVVMSIIISKRRTPKICITNGTNGEVESSPRLKSPYFPLPKFLVITPSMVPTSRRYICKTQTSSYLLLIVAIHYH